MAKKFLTSLGLVSLASDPVSGTEGELYYNNVSDGVRLYKNGAWTDLASTGNLPSGGTTGQILAKTNNTDYNVEWIENYADYTEVVKLRVKNDGTRALYKGQPVYVTGADGTNVLVGRSSNVTEGSSSKTIGILAQNLATNGQGFVIKEGKLGTLNTSAAGAVGDPVWLGVDGALIYGLANKPYAPAHLVYLGVVTKKNGSTGEIFVQVQNGFEIRELHDVGIGYSASIQNNEILAYNSASSVWINQTPSESGIVITDDLLDYLTEISASSTYLTQVDASTTYLTQIDADASFQPLDTVLSNISDLELSSGFLVSNGIDDWYIDENEYLTTANASSTYLSQEDAAVIYLAQSTAASAYQPIGEYLIGEDLNGYLTESSASVIYQPVGDYLIPADLYGYLTESSASTTYQPLDEDLTQISLLNSSTATAGLLATNGSGYWTIDTTAYLTTESDPVFTASDAYGIDSMDISNWNTAYVWGNHASAGYLTTETDPVFTSSDAYDINSTDISNWNIAYGWGNHASAGYAASSHNHTLDSLSNVVITGTPTDGQAIVWDTTTSKWVNETVSGGGASYPEQSGNNGKFLQTDGSSVSWADETDPIFTASEAYNIISLDITNWNYAYGWGDHSLAGYLTEYLEETDPIFTASEAYYITNTDTSNWNDSYSWGDHALAGYLTSYSETSTLEDVTDRGATTTSPITISNINDSTNPTSGALIVSGGVGIAKDVWIDGNLHVNGTTSTLHTTTVSTHDNIIYLNAAHDSTITNAVGDGTYVTYTADNDYTPGMDIRVTGMTPSGYNISSGDLLTVYSATSTQFVVAKTTTGSFVYGGTAHAKIAANADLGFAGGYYNSGYAHAGLFRDASDGVFKIFDGYTPEPDEATNIDTGHVSFSFAPIKVESLDVSDASTTRTNLGLTIGMNVQAWNSNLEAVSLGTYIGESSITTLGTISSGTWNGNAIGYSYGGTGITTLGTAGQVLKVNSGATGLEWGTVDLSLYAPKASPEFTGTAKIGEAIVKSTSTTITSSSATTIASIPVGLGMVLAECIILLSSASDGSYYTSKISVRGNTSTADLTEYAIIEDGSMNVTFTVVPGSNVLLKVATTNPGVKAKVISTYISAENAAI
jgi:hypothetical protein